MDLLNSLYTSIFGMSVVFVALVSLILIINVQTFALSWFERKRQKAAQTTSSEGGDAIEAELPEDLVSGPPELKLINVDEQTAAMIMAIVCDEIGIAPNELYFKSIRLMEDEQGESGKGV